MKIKRLLTRVGVIACAVIINIALIGGNLAWASEPSEESTSTDDESGVQIKPSRDRQCATILKSWCEGAESNGEGTIKDIIIFVISIFSIGVGTIATIGLIYCGYLILTARDNEQQVTKAKNRFFEIVIGIVIWAIGAGAVLLFIPDEEAADYVNNKGIIIREIKR